MNKTLFYLLVIAVCGLIFLVIFSFLSNEGIYKEPPSTITGLVMDFTRSFFIAIFIVLFFALLSLVFLFVYLLARTGNPEHIQTMIDSNGEMIRKHIIHDRKKVSTTFSGKATKIATDGDVLWLNVIIRRVMEELLYKNSSRIRDEIIDRVNNSLEMPDIIGPIHINDLNIGSHPPQINKIITKQTKDNLIIDVDLEYDDPDAIVSLSTSINMNLPAKNWLMLAVRVIMSKIYIHAKLRFLLTNDLRKLEISLLEQPDFDIVFSNEIGDRTTIKNPPYIADVINRAIFIKLRDTLLSPNKIEIQLPAIDIIPVKKQEKDLSTNKKKLKLVEDYSENSDHEFSDEVNDEFSESSISDEEEIEIKPVIRQRKVQKTKQKK